jgi:hypothetical protein
VIKDTGVVGTARRGNRDEDATTIVACRPGVRRSLICQCHDGTAQEHLKAAGPRAVCGYLMAK